MKMDARFKPELIVSKDKQRVAIATCYLQGKFLLATDGRMLVKIPVEREEGDTDGPVTIEAIAAARKLGRKLGLVVIACNDALVTPDGASFPRNAAVSYPQVEQAIPGKRKEVKLGLNAALLKALADALGDDGKTGVVLAYEVGADGTPGTTPISITLNCAAGGRDGIKAVLMPMRV